MSHQTTMNGQHNGASPTSGVGSNLAGLTHDLMTLGELQCQLIGVDLREVLSKSIVPAMVIVGSILLGLGTMPVILLGIGWSLVNLAGFSIGVTFLIVSLIALILAASATWWGLTRLIHALGTLQRSQSELAENLRWVKRALLQQDTRSEVYRQRV